MGKILALMFFLANAAFAAGRSALPPGERAYLPVDYQGPISPIRTALLDSIETWRLFLSQDSRESLRQKYLAELQEIHKRASHRLSSGSFVPMTKSGLRGLVSQFIDWERRLRREMFENPLSGQAANRAEFDSWLDRKLQPTAHARRLGQGRVYAQKVGQALRGMAQTAASGDLQKRIYDGAALRRPVAAVAVPGQGRLIHPPAAGRFAPRGSEERVKLLIQRGCRNWALTDAIYHTSRKFGAYPGWVFSMIMAESACDPNAISPKGARGLMQLMPATAVQIANNLGMTDRNKKPYNSMTIVELLKDPAANTYFGILHYRDHLAEFARSEERR